MIQKKEKKNIRDYLLAVREMMMMMMKEFYFCLIAHKAKGQVSATHMVLMLLFLYMNHNKNAICATDIAHHFNSLLLPLHPHKENFFLLPCYV